MDKEWANKDGATCCFSQPYFLQNGCHTWECIPVCERKGSRWNPQEDEQGWKRNTQQQKASRKHQILNQRRGLRPLVIHLYHNMQDNTVIMPQRDGLNHQHGWLMNSNGNNSFAAETRTAWGDGYHPLMVFTASLSHSMWSLPLIDELRWVLQGVIHKLSEVP